MKRPATTLVVASVALGAALIGVTGARRFGRAAPCGQGFTRHGARCCPSPSGDAPAGQCAPATTCPAPLIATARGCDAPERSVVRVPDTSLVLGPSDWEAEGRVEPRTVRAGPFFLDRFEVTVGRARRATSPLADAAALASSDPARAVSRVTLDEARAFCRARGGRLPTEDEWIVAAAGARARRYPWGDTGAVCRRAAWGLANGPCGSGARGPDTVGSHPDGATPLGVHDLAGNVAEWVEAPSGAAVTRGGSYESQLATALRTWVRVERSPDTRAPTIGFRCAYDEDPSRSSSRPDSSSRPER